MNYNTASCPFTHLTLWTVRVALLARPGAWFRNSALSAGRKAVTYQMHCVTAAHPPGNEIAGSPWGLRWTHPGQTTVSLLNRNEGNEVPDVWGKLLAALRVPLRLHQETPEPPSPQAAPSDASDSMPTIGKALKVRWRA